MSFKNYLNNGISSGVQDIDKIEKEEREIIGEALFGIDSSKLGEL
jgi:hypothetical protein